MVFSKIKAASSPGHLLCWTSFVGCRLSTSRSRTTAGSWYGPWTWTTLTWYVTPPRRPTLSWGGSINNSASLSHSKYYVFVPSTCTTALSSIIKYVQLKLSAYQCCCTLFSSKQRPITILPRAKFEAFYLIIWLCFCLESYLLLLSYFETSHENYIFIIKAVNLILI